VGVRPQPRAIPALKGQRGMESRAGLM
jgi:hypothetical protein